MNHQRIIEALGPLAPLYNDPQVREIIVDAPDKVLVERNGEIKQSKVFFESTEALRQTIDKVLALGGVTLGAEKTSNQMPLDTTSHILAVIPPTAVNGPTLVIRKGAIGQMTMSDLLRFKSLNESMQDLFKKAIQARCNILVAGGNNSGKTAFANILTNIYPKNERVAVVDTGQELQPQERNPIRFSIDNSPGHKIGDLIQLATQMRPDRLVIGELHGTEALDAFHVFNQYHGSSLVTLKADSVEDALQRLERMFMMGTPDSGLEEIRKIIGRELRLISYQQLLRDGRRKITEIVEISKWENNRYTLNPIYKFDFNTYEHQATDYLPDWAE